MCAVPDGGTISASAGSGLSVTLVIPAHNEGPRIGNVLSTIPAFVKRIIVVDDASSDDTTQVVEAAEDARIELIRHTHNTGVGGAMKTGYRAAIKRPCDVVVKMDADGQMDPDEMERLVAPITLGLADYTKGNRFYFRGATKGMPAARSFGNSVLSLLNKAASGYWHVFDPQCGYTAIRASFLRLIDIDSIADDYFFENDMLIKLNALGAFVVDVPTATLYGSEQSGVNVTRVALTFPARLFAAGASRFWHKHLVTDFGAVAVLTLGGAALCLFGAVFGGYHWWLSSDTGHAATTGTIMIAVLPLIVGLQSILQAFAMTVSSSLGAHETSEYVRLIIEQGEPLLGQESATAE